MPRSAVIKINMSPKVQTIVLMESRTEVAQQTMARPTETDFLRKKASRSVAIHALLNSRQQ
jgi:hypothetical protein